MSKVFDIRGTHGSGKTTVAREFTEGATPLHARPLTHPGKKTTLGYKIHELNLIVVGKYDTPCGGCDGIKTQDEIKARVDLFLKHGHNVLLEGILVAHTYGPWEEFARGKDWNFVILDTPLEVCIERVNARRMARGQGPLPDPKNIIRDWHRIHKVGHLMEAAGHRVHRTASHEAPHLIRKHIHETR